MPILPSGCRAFAVKPRVAYYKLAMEPRAWVGSNLGRSFCLAGSMPRLGAQHTTHPHAATPLASPVSGSGADQPPGLPPRSSPPGAPPGRTVETAALSRLPAHDSRTVLVLFSGPYNRPDEIAAFLAQAGFASECIDYHANHGGGAKHDLHWPAGAYASPPCSTFSVYRFFSSSTADDGEPPPVRDRNNILGLGDVLPHHVRELAQANLLVQQRTASVLRAASDAGSEYLLEHPRTEGTCRRRSSHTLATDRSGGCWTSRLCVLMTPALS
eukprot:4824595-Pleurochrysis_carterae.AAC.1